MISTTQTTFQQDNNKTVSINLRDKLRSQKQAINTTFYDTLRTNNQPHHMQAVPVVTQSLDTTTQ